MMAANDVVDDFYKNLSFWASKMKYEISLIESQNADLQAQVAYLDGELARLENENAALKQEITALKTKPQAEAELPLVVGCWIEITKLESASDYKYIAIGKRYKVTGIDDGGEPWFIGDNGEPNFMWGRKKNFRVVSAPGGEA
jgi:hypothetical protein